MVTRYYMEASALRHAHTTVGRAFCMALGILHLAGRADGSATYRVREQEEIMECFRNERSPMDWR